MGTIGTMLLEKVLGKGLEKVAGIAGGLGIPGIGPAIAVTKGVKEYGDKRAEDTRDNARKALGCTHIQLFPLGWSNPRAAMVECVTTYKSCAFFVEGAVLFHPTQANLDVRQLSTNVYHWYGSGWTDTPHRRVEPCTVCKPPSGQPAPPAPPSGA